MRLAAHVGAGSVARLLAIMPAAEIAHWEARDFRCPVGPEWPASWPTAAIYQSHGINMPAAKIHGFIVGDPDPEPEQSIDEQKRVAESAGMVDPADAKTTRRNRARNHRAPSKVE